MLQGVSWSQFFIFLAGCLAGYYGFLCWKYYRFHFIKLVTKINQPSLRNSSEKERVMDQFSAATECSLKIKEVISSVHSSSNKQEVVYAIQQILKRYQWLIDTPFQIALNNLIVNGLEQRGSFQVEAEEISLMWLVEGEGSPGRWAV